MKVFIRFFLMRKTTTKKKTTAKKTVKKKAVPIKNPPVSKQPVQKIPRDLRAKIGFYLDDPETTTGKAIDLIMLFFNLLACSLFVFSSYLKNGSPTWLTIAEIAVVIVFSAEYILRLWSSPKSLKYIFSFYGIIDLISILPSFITVKGLTFLWAFKVLRILRFLRYFKDERFFFGRLNRLQLQAARTVLTILIILFVSSGFILYTEAGMPGAKINTFGEAFYFCVATLTTVGFGDFVPVTATGRWFTVSMILVGIILIPWQAGRLVKMLVSSEKHKRHVVCNACGLTDHDPDASHCKSCGAVIFQEYQGES